MFSHREKEILKEAFERYNKEYSEKLPTEAELENITVSKKLDRKLKRSMFHGRHFYYSLVNTVTKKVACIACFIIIFSILAASPFSVKAVRDKSYEFVVSVHEKYSRLTVEATTTTEFSAIFPSYIPEGFKLFQKNEDNSSVFYHYKDKNGRILYYSQDIINGYSMSINTENTTYETVYINGYESIYYENFGFASILIPTEDYVFCVDGDIGKAEVMKIAQSIFN